MAKIYSTTVPQLNTFSKNENHSLQISLPLKKRRKPQVQSIPGVSPRERNRYQVVFGGEIVATALTGEQALALAKGLRSGKIAQLQGGED